MNINFKEGVEKIVFDPNNPPDFVYESNEAADDASGIYEWQEWFIGDEIIKEGDIIFYKSIPPDSPNRIEFLVIGGNAKEELIESIGE